MSNDKNKPESEAVKGDRAIGENVGFQRVRRITGYLSPLDRFNNAKRVEEADRIPHPVQ